MKHVSLLGSKADPFGEQGGPMLRRRFRILGATFELESSDPRPLRLAAHAYAGLPRHRLDVPARSFRISLRVDRASTLGSAREPPPLHLHGANGLLGGMIDASNFALLAPELGQGLVALSSDMLRHPYHARYELLEFSVYTLAARALGLISLHAACLAVGTRGVLLIGNAGAGKSTLALHCLRRGVQLISEDSTFVTPRALQATGVPTFLHLRDSSLEWLTERERTRISKFPVIQRRSGVQKIEVDVRRIRWPIARAAPRLTAIVFLTKQKGSSEGDRAPLLTPLSAKEALQRLAISQSYAAGRPGWAEFAARASKLPAYELRRGAHPDEGVDEMRELFSRASRTNEGGTKGSRKR